MSSGGADSLRTRRRHLRPSRGDGFRRGARETAFIIVSALILSALVRAFLVQAFYVPSASMEDTLMVSDRIIASKISTRISGVARGEVVVFRDPGDWLPDPPLPADTLRSKARSALTFIGLLPSDTGQDLVKRAIGVAGDRVACCDTQGRIEVNGVGLDEPYIKGPTDQVAFDIVVPPKSMFVLGDNRGDSRDSRYHLEVNNGAIPLANAVGRVILVVWPFKSFGTLSIPKTFGSIPATAGKGGN